MRCARPALLLALSSVACGSRENAPPRPIDATRVCDGTIAAPPEALVLRVDDPAGATHAHALADSLQGSDRTELDRYIGDAHVFASRAKALDATRRALSSELDALASALAAARALGTPNAGGLVDALGGNAALDDAASRVATTAVGAPAWVALQAAHDDLENSAGRIVDAANQDRRPPDLSIAAASRFADAADSQAQPRLAALVRVYGACELAAARADVFTDLRSPPREAARSFSLSVHPNNDTVIQSLVVVCPPRVADVSALQAAVEGLHRSCDDLRPALGLAPPRDTRAHDLDAAISALRDAER